VQVKQAADGRWMWGVSYDDRNGGFGFYPFEKWGKFATSRAEAIKAGFVEMKERLVERKENFHHAADTNLLRWIQEQIDPVQGDLFA
jgi:hypothetical protein